VPIPDVKITDSWEEAWLGHELTMRATGLAEATIRLRRTAFNSLSKHAVAEGLDDPSLVTKSWMMKYAAAQIKARKNLGAVEHHQLCQQFWAWYAQEFGTTSPMTGIPRPKVYSPPPPVLTAKQLKAILAACEGTGWMQVRDRAVVLLLLESGLRRAELAGLRTGDIDLRERTVRVARGKGGRPRISVFGDATALALHRWLRVRPVVEHDHLFCSRTGAPTTPSALSQLLTKLGREAGVPGLRPHLFRHTWAHYNMDQRVPEQSIMVLAGWTSPRQLGRYGSALAAERAITAGKAVQVGKVAM
jgi:integrase/recombinase XerC